MDKLHQIPVEQHLKTITFGKYKGKEFSIVYNDKNYVDWCLQKDGKIENNDNFIAFIQYIKDRKRS